MFFKRIEMTGFKSFATRTVVEFLPGVTVIVGPNGCGKSNVFDAIRWVLGEQSARSLRGTKMGDVIFQGSATYKPMGCSQVTLVLNNEERRLPIDFSEISISRRLYRSGESEYLLNKIPCRLRDIHELFLDTGVGTSSYSIMEQGRVDEIVRSKPEDRRAIFEEAAGISKYKNRKAEALRKLEKTEQDLTRLADRIGESRTRCNSLKRQAAKAERYKSLKDAADSADLKILSVRLRRVRGESERIEKIFKEASDRLTAARTKNATAQARREELQLRIELSEGALQDLYTQKEDQRIYIQECAAEIIRLQGKAEAEKRRATDMNRQIAETMLRAEELSVNLADANAEEARLTIRCIELEAKQAHRRAEYDRMRADSDETLNEIRRTRKSIDDAGERAMRLRNERNQIQLLMEQAQASIESFDQEKVEHETRLAQLEEEIGEKAAALEGRKGDLKAQEGDDTSAKERLATAVQRRETLRREHRAAEQQLSQAKSHLSALERLARDYEGYYGGVKAIMQACERHELDGIVGAVPELIQSIDAENDLAIEVALGNHVQDIIVRNSDSGKRAIEYLKQEKIGRATFIPLDMIDPGRPDAMVNSVIGQAGVIGVASKLVTYDRDIEKAVEFLLGRTVLTQDLDVALRLERSGKRNRYVSLDGGLIAPSGTMTGGSRNKSGIITRQREITDLAQQVRTLTETEADLSRRVQKHESAIINDEALRAKLRDKIGELRLEMGRMESGIGALRNAHAERKQTLDGLTNRVESSRTNREAYEQKLEAASLELQALDEQIEKQREQLHMMEQAIYGRREETESLGEKVSQADQEISRMSERASHLREMSESFAHERDGQSRRITALRHEQEESNQEAVALVKQCERTRLEKEALEVEVAGVDGKITIAVKEKDAANLAVRSELDNSAGLMREINEATNALSEIQAERVNSQAEIRHIKESAESIYGRTLEQIAEEVGEVTEERSDLEDEHTRLMDELRKMGDNINMHALIEYKEESERLEFLETQEKDLTDAKNSLAETIATADKTSRELFCDAFEKIRDNFIDVYRRLFGGGKADLILQEPATGDSMLEGGIEIVAQPPGKKLQNISLLSGGEKALTAIALMFAIFMYKPSPFCVMDEIDAPLDDVNVGRFRDMLHEFSERTQFLIITHNKITMDLADTLYGITMQETGVSSLVSVSFDQLEQLEVVSVS